MFTENTLYWEEVLQRKEKLDLTHFKAMSGDEQLEWLEKITRIVVQAQNVNIEQATRRVEAQRLMEEAKRMFQEHEQNPTLQALGPSIVTHVDMCMVEGGQTPTRETSPVGNNEQPDERHAGGATRI